MSRDGVNYTPKEVERRHSRAYPGTGWLLTQLGLVMDPYCTVLRGRRLACMIQELCLEYL
jgi:hypothetical protein